MAIRCRLETNKRQFYENLYPFWMQDGALAGARYDAAIVDKSERGPTDAGGRFLTPAAVALSTNDPDTVPNEAATMLVIAEEEYPVGALLGGGSASKTGATFVEEARAEVEKLAGQVTALANLNASLDREDRTDYSTIIKLRWAEAQKEVDSIFGKGGVTLPSLSERAGRVDETRAVGDFEELLDALSSAVVFEAAVDDGILSDGAKAALDNKAASEVFGAVTSESSAGLGVTETTRYGVFATMGRRTASDDLKFTVAGADTDEHQGAIGAFAYGLVADTVRTSHLPTSGTASYEGGTTAVSGGREPELYSGMFSMEVNFPTSRVTALITNLQDEQGNPWQYQLRDAESIYFPGVNLDGTAHFKARTGYQASVTHVGFAAQPLPAGDTEFEGRLLGAGRDLEAGTGAFGTWSLGDRQNAGTSYLVGSFGAERTSVRQTDRPSVGAAVSESWITQGPEMDDLFFKQGGTVFRPTAGADHPDDEDTVYEIDLAFLENDADGKTVTKGNLQIDDLRSEIEGELAKLEGYIAVDEADGSSVTQRANRNEVWTKIKTRLLKVVFKVGTDKIYANSKSRPVYDAELKLRPSGSTAPTSTSSYYVDADADGSYDAGEEVTLDERMELKVLSTDLYPGLTSTTSGTPNDDAARQEIQAVLDALTNGTTLGEALDEGGLFEGLLAETHTVYQDDNYDGYADVKNEKRLVSNANASVAGSARTFKTHVQLGSTDYTRFGTAWGKQSTKAFAYSPLPQVQYANTSSPGYPGGANATYKGSTIFRQGTVPYEGNVEVDVSWDADTIGDSRVTVTFSEMAKIADSAPLSIGYILVDSNGNRLLKNGNSATAGSTTGMIDYHAYETANGGMYRGIADTQVVSGNSITIPEAHGTPAAGSALQRSKDPRNGFADKEWFDVDELVFRSNIKVTNEGQMLAFSTSSSITGGTTALADVHVVWADRSFENTSLVAVGEGSTTGLGGSIDGEFVGQGSDGPLAAMGIWTFVAPEGLLQAAAVGKTSQVLIGESTVRVYPGWDDETVVFAPAVDESGAAAGRFDPNVRSTATIGAFQAHPGTGEFHGSSISVAETATIQGYVRSWKNVDGYLETTTDFGPPISGGKDPAETTSYGTEIFGAFGTGP